MNLKITKKDWIFLSFVRTRLQKRRARQANAPERLAPPPSAAPPSAAKVRVVLSSRTKIGEVFLRGCARLFFFVVYRLFLCSFRSNFCFSRAGFRRGLAFGSEKNQIEVPRSCAFPVLRFRSARRRERAHRLERDRA